MPNPESTATNRRRAAQRLALAYQRAFATEDGQAVLADLKETFRLEDRVFTPVSVGSHFAYDPLTAALADGGRAVVLHILTKLAVTPRGDANLTSEELTHP